MIWLFKIDEVFWIPKEVNEYYLFDTNDIDFDIDQYHIDLYIGTSNYYFLSEDNDQEIYMLRYPSPRNGTRLVISFTSETYKTIRSFYIKTQRDKKINKILN